MPNSKEPSAPAFGKLESMDKLFPASNRLDKPVKAKTSGAAREFQLDNFEARVRLARLEAPETAATLTLKRLRIKGIVSNKTSISADQKTIEKKFSYFGGLSSQRRYFEQTTGDDGAVKYKATGKEQSNLLRKRNVKYATDTTPRTVSKSTLFGRIAVREEKVGNEWKTTGRKFGPYAFNLGPETNGVRKKKTLYSEYFQLTHDVDSKTGQQTRTGYKVPGWSKISSATADPNIRVVTKTSFGGMNSESYMSTLAADGKTKIRIPLEKKTLFSKMTTTFATDTTPASRTKSGRTETFDPATGTKSVTSRGLFGGKKSFDVVKMTDKDFLVAKALGAAPARGVPASLAKQEPRAAPQAGLITARERGLAPIKTGRSQLSSDASSYAPDSPYFSPQSARTTRAQPVGVAVPPAAIANNAPPSVADSNVTLSPRAQRSRMARFSNTPTDVSPPAAEPVAHMQRAKSRGTATPLTAESLAAHTAMMKQTTSKSMSPAQSSPASAKAAPSLADSDKTLTPSAQRALIASFKSPPTTPAKETQRAAPGSPATSIADSDKTLPPEMQRARMERFRDSGLPDRA